MLVEGSAIAPEVIAESGARTIDKPGELPREFSERQRRRAPGILFPVHRPNGEPSWCFRPERVDPERPGHRYEQPPKSRGAAGNALGVLPSQRHLIGDVRVPVVFVEGVKKQLSLITATRAARKRILVVAITGVWNWLHDGGKPIPDMASIALEGRDATVMFDSDVLCKVEVQEAARRLAEHLQERGANVFVTYFKDKPDGSKCGADDFFASGGTLRELRLLTRAYEPDDFRRVRLSRDERLRAMLGDLWHRYAAKPAAKIAECSDRATMRELLRRAELSGHPTDRGIVVRAPSRSLANHTHMTQRAQVKSLKRLERDGYLERIEEPKRKIEEKGAAYLLKPSTDGLGRALRSHSETESQQQNVSREQSAKRDPLSYADLYAGENATRASSDVPELRHSKVVHAWARRDGRRVVVDSQYVFRLAKPRQEVVMYLLDNGGEADEAELLERFGSKSTRLRDFRRRRIAPLLGYRYSRDQETGQERRLETGPPIVSCEGGVVRLLTEWREALEEHRKQTGELEDNERQAERYRRQSEAYRKRDRRPADKQTSPLRGKEEVRRIVEELRKQENGRWVEEQRQKVGETGLTFLSGEMTDAVCVQFRDVRERWTRRGGRVEELRRAVLFGPFVFKREAADGALYVYHEDGRQEDAYDHMVRERIQAHKQRTEKAARKLPPKVAGVYHHGARCDCWLCGSGA
jgi:hypothetical protein